MPKKKEISYEELENELDKAFKENDPKREGCGTAVPFSKEIGVQRTNLRVKKK